MSRQRILDLLAEHEQLTAAEIHQLSGLPRNLVRSQCHFLNRDLPATPKRIYVADWVHDAPGRRYYPRKVYALGNLPDKRKPPVNTLERDRLRWHQSVRRSVVSVFDLGKTVKQRLGRTTASA